MIKLTKSSGLAVYISPDDVAEVHQASPNGGQIRSIVVRTGGAQLEVQETAEEVARIIEGAAKS